MLSSIYQAYVFLPKRLHSKHCMRLFVYVKNQFDCFRNLDAEWEKHDQSSDIISNCGKGTNDVSCALQSSIITHSIWIRFVVLETIKASLRCTFFETLIYADIRVLPYYTKLSILSTLYCFIVKDKFIAKSFPLLGLEHQHLKISSQCLSI